MRRLKELRRERRMTQSDLAQILNISTGAISMYEKGLRQPTFETLKRIADIFGVTIDYLLETEVIPAGMSAFTYAMHGAEKDLTDRDKAILLQMAKSLAEANRQVEE